MEDLDGDERAEFELGVAYATQQCADLLPRLGLHPACISTRSIAGPPPASIWSAFHASRPWEDREPPPRPVPPEALCRRPPPPWPNARLFDPFFDNSPHLLRRVRRGRQAALVLIHGLLMSRRMFDRLRPRDGQKRGNRVITLDLLGHGRSDRPPIFDVWLLDDVLCPPGRGSTRSPRARPGPRRGRHLPGGQYDPLELNFIWLPSA